MSCTTYFVLNCARSRSIVRGICTHKTHRARHVTSGQGEGRDCDSQVLTRQPPICVCTCVSNSLYLCLHLHLHFNLHPYLFSLSVSVTACVSISESASASVPTCVCVLVCATVAIASAHMIVCATRSAQVTARSNRPRTNDCMSQSVPRKP